MKEGRAEQRWGECGVSAETDPTLPTKGWLEIHITARAEPYDVVWWMMCKKEEMMLAMVQNADETMMLEAKRREMTCRQHESESR